MYSMYLLLFTFKNNLASAFNINSILIHYCLNKPPKKYIYPQRNDIQSFYHF